MKFGPTEQFQCIAMRERAKTAKRETVSFSTFISRCKDIGMTMSDARLQARFCNAMRSEVLIGGSLLTIRRSIPRPGKGGSK